MLAIPPVTMRPDMRGIRAADALSWYVFILFLWRHGDVKAALIPADLGFRSQAVAAATAQWAQGRVPCCGPAYRRGDLFETVEQNWLDFSTGHYHGCVSCGLLKRRIDAIERQLKPGFRLGF